MEYLRAIVLVPIAYAGAFTAFACLEPALMPHSLLDWVIMLALLTPAYAYLVGGLFLVLRLPSGGKFWGLSAIAWCILFFLAYVAGIGCVVLLQFVQNPRPG